MASLTVDAIVSYTEAAVLVEVAVVVVVSAAAADDDGLAGDVVGVEGDDGEMTVAYVDPPLMYLVSSAKTLVDDAEVAAKSSGEAEMVFDLAVEVGVHKNCQSSWDYYLGSLETYYYDIPVGG